MVERRPSRRGVTLVELVLAMAIASVLFIVGQEALFAMRSRRGGLVGAERRATMALELAKVSETLLRDLRSAVEILQPEPGRLDITRNELVEGRLEPRLVRWVQVDDETLAREPEAGRRQVWSFAGLLEAGSPPLRLELLAAGERGEP